MNARTQRPWSARAPRQCSASQSKDANPLENGRLHGRAGGTGPMCLRSTIAPEFIPPIETIARPPLAWERLYDHPVDHFVELMSMLLVLSDQAYYHPRPAETILEGLTRKHDTKDFQMAVVRAHNFLGVSIFCGVLVQTIAGGCFLLRNKS